MDLPLGFNLLYCVEKSGAGLIVDYLKTGSAYYAPGIAITAMVESIIKDRRRMIPCAAFVDEKTSKHYSAQGLFIGLPILIGKNGVDTCSAVLILKVWYLGCALNIKTKMLKSDLNYT